MTAKQRVLRAIAWTAKRFFLLMLFVIMLGLGAGAYGWFWFERNVLSTLPTDLSSFRNYRPPTSCQVYAANGVQIDTFYLERRIWVPLDQLPEIVPKAFIAAEDRRFMEHPGVDLLGILRALWTNLSSGRQRQGGSTITQQLVKNLIVGKERSYIRKMREAALAFRLEQELSKREIIELYLNYIALGSGNYGVEAAAQDYFGISARELDAGQAALLAGLVPAPSRYSPRSSLERAARRRAIVLDSMEELHFVTHEEADRYSRGPVLAPRDTKRDRLLGAAYATEVRRDLRRTMPADVAATGGLKVHTALDLELQRVAEQGVRDAIAALEGRQGRAGVVRHLAPEHRKDFVTRGPGLERTRTGELAEPRAGECFESMVPDSRSLDALVAGNWVFSMEPSDRAVKVRGHKEGMPAGPLQAMITPGDVVRVCLEESGRVKLDPRPWPEGAAVVIENTTGRILAIVGGNEVSIEGFDRATQAHRQPGSSFKPYVYAAALMSGLTQLDKMNDAPIGLPGSNGKIWSPKNYDGKYHGVVTLRSAIAQSLNTVAVRLTLHVGVEEVIQTARRMGLRSALRNDPTIALGSNEVTLMDHAMAYSTLARMGMRTEPVYIDSLNDALDHPIGTPGADVVLNGQRLGKLSGGPGRRVLPAGVAYELVDMMRGVVMRGTARSAFKPGFDRAGKTGTTNGFVDAWFVGFTPRYTVGVWIGTDGPQTLGDKETGGRTALPAWVKIIEALPHVEGERFAVPDDAVLVRVDNEWVGLPRGSVPDTVLPLGLIGSEPLPDFDDAPPPPRTVVAARTSTTAS